jgi:hypothetical protein
LTGAYLSSQTTLKGASYLKDEYDAPLCVYLRLNAIITAAIRRTGCRYHKNSRLPVKANKPNRDRNAVFFKKTVTKTGFSVLI